jgi:RNA-directed DNA polymerase
MGVDLTKHSLEIYRPKQLANLLGFEESALRVLASEVQNTAKRSKYINEFTIVDPREDRKRRDVISIRGDFKTVQRRIYERILSKVIKPGPSSHGGIRGKSIKSNAESHLGNVYAYQTDIANFFPSIHRDRVRSVLQNCVGSRDVAELLAQLVTLDDHLALGLVTSPILAEAVIQSVDTRISGACLERGLTYSRFVDDICISGSFSIEKSGIPSMVRRILQENGFQIRAEKDRFVSLSSDLFSLTGIEIRKNRLRVPQRYIDDLIRDLESAKAIAMGREHPVNWYYTREQMVGRIQFVRWINKGQSSLLLKKFNKINWRLHSKEALLRGLIVSKPRSIDRSSSAVFDGAVVGESIALESKSPSKESSDNERTPA